MNIGFTGTQLGMTDYQLVEVRRLLTELFNPDDAMWFHHGDCIGADAQAHKIAHEIGYMTHKYPSTITSKCANSEFYTLTEKPKDPLLRNRDIVDAVSIMIATPKELEEVMRSGTWATVRYTRKQGKTLHLIAPRKD